MLAGLFRSNRPSVLLGVPILVIALFSGSVMRQHPRTDPAMPLYVLAQEFMSSTQWMPGVLGMVLAAIIAIQLAGLSNNAELLGRRNHLPALLFPLLLAVLGRSGPMEPVIAGPALLGMPMVILALDRMLSIANTGRALGALFDAGLLLGLAAMCYLPYCFLVVVVWASVSVIRPFQWREYVVPLLGCALLFYISWAVLLLLGLDIWQPFGTVVHDGDRTPVPNQAWWVMLNGLMVPMILVALAGFASGYQRGVMRDKNLRSSFMAFFTGSGVIIGFSWFLDKDYPAVLLAAPLAIFMAHALIGTRRAWLSEVAVFALLVLALWVQWGRGSGLG